MEPRTLTKQTLSVSTPNVQEIAVKYYTILSVLGDMHLTPRELQLLAFTATRGSISPGGAKQQFIEQYNTSKATVGNLITSLTEKNLLVKENKQVRVAPQLRRNFKNLACLKLDISLVKAEENGSTEGN